MICVVVLAVPLSVPGSKGEEQGSGGQKAQWGAGRGVTVISAATVPSSGKGL